MSIGMQTTCLVSLTHSHITQMQSTIYNWSLTLCKIYF